MIASSAAVLPRRCPTAVSLREAVLVQLGQSCQRDASFRLFAAAPVAGLKVAAHFSRRLQLQPGPEPELPVAVTQIANRHSRTHIAVRHHTHRLQVVY